MPSLPTPEIGLHSAKQVPGVAQRRNMARGVHSVRICHDNRPYYPVAWTIGGTPQVAKYGPMEPMHRDFYVARITAQVGRHDDATHPLDGTPGGQGLRMNLRRIDFDETEDDPILNSDARLNIRADHHRDAINDEDDGAYEVDDFNIRRLAEGDKVYPEILQVGTTRPGTLLVITLVLVPIP